MKFSEQDPHLAAMWLPYEEAEEHFEQGRLPETIAKCEEALRAGEGLLGPDSKYLLLVLSLLAGSYYNANRSADALPLCLRQIEIARAAVGARHPYYGEVQRITARVYRALGRPADALPLDKYNVAIQVLTHGRAHPATIQGTVALIEDYQDLGDQVERKRYLEVAERLISIVDGVDDYSVEAITWHRTQLGGKAVRYADDESPHCRSGYADRSRYRRDTLL